MADLPPVDDAIVERAERAADGFMRRWLDWVPVEIASFGAVAAPAAPDAPDVDFQNRPLFLHDPGAADVIHDVVDRYEAAGVRPWYELAPGPRFESLAGRLAARGAAQTGFYAVMYGLPGAPPVTAPPGGVRVRAAGSSDGELFARLAVEGREVPEQARGVAAAGVRPWVDQPSWRCYIAELEGEPVATGVLAVEGATAYLASAETIPAARRQGAQSALLRQRLADAAAAGADLVVALCAFGSASHRNMHRAGLRLAYLRAVWRGAAGPTG